MQYNNENNCLNRMESLNLNNIVITGFMGVGKSTVGKLVAEPLARNFIDMDATIEEEEKISIREIFTERGEPYFRKCESRLVEKLCKMRSLVIATGGGTFLQWKSHELFFANQAFIVSLTAPLSEILKRLSDPLCRPLLASRTRNETALKDLFESRQSIYNKLTNKVDTTGKTAKEVANLVLDLFYHSSLSKK